MLIDPTAKIHPSALIGPNVTIGPNVVVGEGARIQRSVLLANSQVKDHAWVKSTIVGWNPELESGLELKVLPSWVTTSK